MLRLAPLLDRRRFLGAAALACCGSAWAADEERAPTEAVYATRTNLDRSGRIMAPVTVNGAGPFRFLLDTGASRSALSERLAQRLGLAIDPDAGIRVRGVTGDAVLPAVRIERLQAGALVLRHARLPVLAQDVLADADGILGIEGLAGKRLDIDFAADRVSIDRSLSRGAAPGFLVVPATLRFGGLLVVDARIGRVRGRAIVDTGAERTLGNRALQRALLASREPGAAREATLVLGATPDVQDGESRLAPLIRVGEAILESVEVTFGDLHVFHVWDLEREPALLLGMDLLGVAERLVIDYRRAELHIQPRRGRRG